jgi:integration host factor subunit beta
MVWVCAPGGATCAQNKQLFGGGNGSVTKNDMVIEIAKKTNVEQQKVKQIVQLTLDSIVEILSSEKRIELRNFGVFEVRTRKARKARNPRTGAEVMVPSKQVVTFKAGKIMEEKIETSAPPVPAIKSPASSAPQASATPSTTTPVGS